MNTLNLNKPQNATHGTQGRYKKAGLLVFGFFLIKGLAWLSVPFWLWLGVS